MMPMRLRLSEALCLVPVLCLTAPVCADFQVLSGQGSVLAVAGDSTGSASGSGVAGDLRASAHGTLDVHSFTVVTGLRWGTGISPFGGFAISASLVPEFDAFPGSVQLSEVQGSWTLRIGSTDEPFEAVNTFLHAPPPTLSIFDLTVNQLVNVLGGNFRFFDGVLLAGHEYRLDLAGQTTLESAGLDFITQSAPGPEPIPEPASAALGLIGWAIVSARRR